MSMYELFAGLSNMKHNKKLKKSIKIIEKEAYAIEKLPEDSSKM